MSKNIDDVVEKVLPKQRYETVDDLNNGDQVERAVYDYSFAQSQLKQAIQDKKLVVPLRDSQLTEQIKSLESQLEKAEKLDEENALMVRVIEAKIDSDKKHIEFLESQLATANAKIVELEKEANRLCKVIVEYQNISDEIEAELTEAHNTIGIMCDDKLALEAKVKELEKKCKNLDSIIGSLDVKDPNACDALLNVQLINQKTIHELKLENKALRDMYDGTQIVLGETREKLKDSKHTIDSLNEELRLESVRYKGICDYYKFLESEIKGVIKLESELSTANKKVADLEESLEVENERAQVFVDLANKSNKKAEKLVEALEEISKCDTDVYVSDLAEQALKEFRGEK